MLLTVRIADGKTWVSQLCCYFLSEVFELEIVIINAKIMFWTHFPDFFRL